MIKVLIADNHPIIRMGVRAVLDSANGFEMVDDVSTTEELFQKLQIVTPDVVMLEMDIPEMNGIAALRKIKKASKLLNVFSPLPQILENIFVKNKSIIDSSNCKKAVKTAKNLMGKNGRILVRKSGTEPKIRIMAESNNKKLIKKCINIIKRSIK